MDLFPFRYLLDLSPALQINTGKLSSYLVCCGRMEYRYLGPQCRFSDFSDLPVAVVNKIIASFSFLLGGSWEMPMFSRPLKVKRKKLVTQSIVTPTARQGLCSRGPLRPALIGHEVLRSTLLRKSDPCVQQSTLRRKRSLCFA